jgi:hypothetical protein
MMTWSTDQEDDQGEKYLTTKTGTVNHSHYDCKRLVWAVITKMQLLKNGWLFLTRHAQTRNSQSRNSKSDLNSTQYKLDIHKLDKIKLSQLT